MGMLELRNKMLTIGIIVVGILTACAPVQPWERGNLAKPQMALVRRLG